MPRGDASFASDRLQVGRLGLAAHANAIAVARQLRNLRHGKEGANERQREGGETETQSPDPL